MTEHVLPFPGRPGGVAPEVVSAIEALLFASGEPINSARLAQIIDIPTEQVRIAIALLQDRYSEGRGVVLGRVADGWQLRTAPAFSPLVMALRGAKPKKLPRPQLEVLSSVAWQQPVTRGEVDRVRGVDSGPIIRKLLDRGYLRVSGRRDEPGRPLEYRTTKAFLTVFGLPSLTALPRLDERREVSKSEE
ncbi:MAG: SMC-Scp complex subunit ScpB [Rhodobacterales bacterium]|nr:SMC-Scp complex subunit ScpB [Rhodobacterales bacterium]